MTSGCLIDVYNTILVSNYVSRMETLIEPLGIAIGDWLAEWDTMHEDRDRGRITVAASMERTLRQLGFVPEPGLVAELAQRDVELSRASVRLFEDTVPFLTWLRANKIATALVSNCADTTRAQLDYLGVTALVDAVVLSCEVGSIKPYPDIYVTALEDLGIAAVDAVFIDDLPAFCLGAQAVGVRPIQIARGDRGAGPSRLDFPVIHSLPEAIALLLAVALEMMATSCCLASCGRLGGMSTGALPHVVVVGGGITGLAAAFYLRDYPVRVTVLEGSARIGGKLSASDVAGVAMDEGAEALLARRPEGIELITAAGLGADLVPAGVTSSAIYTRGALRTLPRRQFMGVPADPDELAATGVVSAGGADRARHEAALPAPDADVSVTEYIGSRLGAEVVDRLVDPLLGGVYAGRSEDLSFTATLTPLAVAARTRPTLTEAVTSLLPPPPSPGNSKKAAPVFVTLTTGLGALPEAVAKASGADVRTSSMVRELRRTGPGWRLTIGSAADPEYLDADAVILATPAAPAARLLKAAAAAAASQLEQIPYASMAIITLAYRDTDFPVQQRSGYLVPAVDGRVVKAATFSTVKWPHLARQAPVHVVRCSVGRSGDVAVLQRDDADLAAVAAAELAEAIGIGAPPVEHRVTRWGGGLPQYNVGHLDRVARIRSSVAEVPGLAVAGAAYDGVGIPACAATAKAAVAQVTAHLEARPR